MLRGNGWEMCPFGGLYFSTAWVDSLSDTTLAMVVRQLTHIADDPDRMTLHCAGLCIDCWDAPCKNPRSAFVDVAEYFQWKAALQRYRAVLADLPRLRHAFNAQRKPLAKAVTARDGYQCQKCGETVGLGLDHIRPLSRGGQSTPDNLRWLCQAHNSHKSHGSSRGTTGVYRFPLQTAS